MVTTCLYTAFKEHMKEAAFLIHLSLFIEVITVHNLDFLLIMKSQYNSLTKVFAG